MKPLKIDARILTQQVRLSAPCLIEVSLTNHSNKPLLVNRRLAVGYRDSEARELFVEAFRHGTRDVVSKRSQLYHRDFSAPADYVWLAPGQSITTSFDLFAWYSLPAAGTYELVFYYQADEVLAPKPKGLLPGIHASEVVTLSIEQ